MKKQLNDYFSEEMPCSVKIKDALAFPWSTGYNSIQDPNFTYALYFNDWEFVVNFIEL